eukprot:g5368.t1
MPGHGSQEDNLRPPQEARDSSLGDTWRSLEKTLLQKASLKDWRYLTSLHDDLRSTSDFRESRGWQDRRNDLGGAEVVMEAAVEDIVLREILPLYDVSSYLDDHPGGAEVIIEVAGRDPTNMGEELPNLGGWLYSLPDRVIHAINRAVQEACTTKHRYWSRGRSKSSGWGTFAYVLPLLQVALASTTGKGEGGELVDAIAEHACNHLVENYVKGGFLVAGVVLHATVWWIWRRYGGPVRRWYRGGGGVTVSVIWGRV